MQKTIKINGEILPPEAVQFELERLVRFHAEHGMSQEQIRAQLPELIKAAQEQAIGAKLLLEESKRYDLPVTQEDVDAQVARIVDQIGGEENFKRALEQQQTTLETFRKQLHEGCRMDKLVAKITAGLPEPTEAELEAHFAEHRDEYLQEERVLAQHILITPDGETQTSKDEARERLERIRARLLEGANFADEAAAHSMCPSGKEGGGLGWFSRGMMVPEFDEVVFALKVGDISEAVETQFGYHLILKSDEQEATTPEFAQVADKVREFVRHARRGAALSAHVDELKSKVEIEIV